MRRKPKARGPGILEDVEDEGRVEEENVREGEEEEEMNKERTTQIKIHPILNFDQKYRGGKEGRFLRRIRETKKDVMSLLKRWASKD